MLYVNAWRDTGSINGLMETYHKQTNQLNECYLESEQI